MLGGQPPGMNHEIGQICVVAVAVDTAGIQMARWLGRRPAKPLNIAWSSLQRIAQLREAGDYQARVRITVETVDVNHLLAA